MLAAGNTLYLAVQPLAEGNMTLGIYTDDKCSVISQTIDLTGYIMNLYQNYYYYYGEDKGTQVAQAYQNAIDTWNEKMSVFKVCQPCRAYNLHAEDDAGSGSRSDDHRRFLNGDENDGEGDERERYNCYDDAGYTNVDQCYKFETHTSMEAASSEDLQIASAQGSILRVRAYGRTFGRGGTSRRRRCSRSFRGSSSSRWPSWD